MGKRLLLAGALFAFTWVSAAGFAQKDDQANLPCVKADKELNRVYKKVRMTYKDDPVFLEKLTRKKIFEALRERRFYATSDRNLEVWFEMDGVFIGGETPAQPIHDVVIRVEDPDGDLPEDRIRLLQLVGSGGAVLESLETDAHSVHWQLQLFGVETGYLYLRVTAADRQRAYTAPIWIS